jgi:hypothetical protein
MTVKEAIQVILSDTKNFAGTLNWAVNYCRAAMGMEDGSNELRVQCAYILSNISRWRHPQAKAVREVLKAAARG